MDSDAVLFLLALGPASAVGYYWVIYRHYRNTDKSHAYERDTLISAQPVAGHREKVRHISRTRSSGIDGDNSGSHRARVERLR